MQELTLYHRYGCHLCEDMQQQLLSYRRELGFRLKVVDIDTDPLLVELYGELVPVLMRVDQEICHYFLDLEALKACLATG